MTPNLPASSNSPYLFEKGFIQAAIFFYALAGTVLLVWDGRTHTHLLSPYTVAVVHLYVLGVLTIALIGLGLKQLPIWTGLPLPWPQLNRWILSALIVGALTVFLGIGTNLHRWNLLAASAGVGFGVGFFLAQAGKMLLQTARHDGLILLLKLSILSLAGVLTLGAIFLGEYAHGFLTFDRLAMLGTHLTLGIYGWAGLMLMALRHSFGLSAHARENALPMFPVIGAFLSLAFIPYMLFKPDSGEYWLWSSILPGFASIVMLSVQTAYNRFWRVADFFGVAAFLVLCTWPVWPDERARFLFGVLILPGWTLGQLLGLFDHLRPGKIGLLLLIIHTTTVLLLAIGLFLPWREIWQTGGATMLLSSLLFVIAAKKR
ncbi:MAG: hypothetical protein H7834_13020 [Magnetococcus sp. YQC-9]